MKTVGIMQPYFLPYIGYFQLISMVDEFVLYDNIQFTKKGWINRNRMLQNGKAEYFTLPLKKDSDYLDVKQRYLSEGFEAEKQKILRRISANYKKAPFFKDFYPVIEEVFACSHQNLFDFVFSSINTVMTYLDIDTPLVISSSLPEEIKSLKSEEKVLEICRVLNASTYINPSGGQELYDKNTFKNKSIDLKFVKTNDFSYQQYKNDYIESLSVLDVCMFNDKETVKSFLKEYHNLD